MTDTVSSSDSPRPKRRRLLSRRELRRHGTQIVRVGSANLLQSTRGPYKFASTGTNTSTSEDQLSPEDPPKEEIEVLSDHSSAIAPEDAISSVDVPATPKNKPVAMPSTTPRRPRNQPMYKLTYMSEKARKLRVSPESKRLRSCLLAPPPRLPRLDAFLPPLSPTKRPLPVRREHLGGDILPFSEALPPVHRKSPPVLKLSELAAKPLKRLSLPPVAALEINRLPVTPLRTLHERLKPPKEKPSPFHVIKRPG
ncbi:hypothetical protein H4S07_003937 [Coemansia furcata]|uniref:Uncharacterized protein n=1 Tax=Coemansia furcata TaxID=417177 RepID=A0ACC1LDF9_9FUNG|nr:hypothetical protein H4S07_003937 [Coemansia furcata]